MTFKTISIVTALAGTALGLRFIFAGASVLKDWILGGVSSGIVVPSSLSRARVRFHLGMVGMTVFWPTVLPKLCRGRSPARLRQSTRLTHTLLACATISA